MATSLRLTNLGGPGVPAPPSEYIPHSPLTPADGNRLAFNHTNYRSEFSRATFSFPTSSSRDGGEDDTNLSSNASAGVRHMNTLDVLAAAAAACMPSTSRAPSPPVSTPSPLAHPIPPPSSWAPSPSPQPELEHISTDDHYHTRLTPRRVILKLPAREPSEYSASRSASPVTAGDSGTPPPRDGSQSLIRRRPPRTRLPVPTPNVSRPSRGRHVPTAPGAPAYSDSPSPPVQGLWSTASPPTPPREESEAPPRVRLKLMPKEVVREDMSARVFVCEVEGCGKCFRRREHLKRHMLSLHTNDRPFRCPDCDKVCNRRDNLVQHRKIHAQDAAKS